MNITSYLHTLAVNYNKAYRAWNNYNGNLPHVNASLLFIYAKFYDIQIAIRNDES